MKHEIAIATITRHERDQSFLVPVPVRKKISSRSRRKRNFGPGPGPGEKEILVPVLFRKNFGAGPSQKKFWSRDRDRDQFAHL